MTSEGQDIILTQLDPYCKNIVPPENFKLGLINCILGSQFEMIPDPDQKTIGRPVIVICAALRDVIISGQTCVYSTRNKSFNSAPSCTLKGALLVLPSVLNS